MSQCQNINYLRRKIILNCTLTCLQASTQNNSFFPMLLPQLNYHLDEFIFASLPMSQNKSVWMSTRWWPWCDCSAGDNHVCAPPPQSRQTRADPRSRVWGLSVSGPVLMRISSGASLPSVSPLTRGDLRWPHLPRCGDWPGWCQGSPLLCLVWAYLDEDQERGLTPGVSLSVVIDLIMSKWEFLSETISVATDLRSNNECIEWSKNILEGLM